MLLPIWYAFGSVGRLQLACPHPVPVTAPETSSTSNTIWHPCYTACLIDFVVSGDAFLPSCLACHGAEKSLVAKTAVRVYSNWLIHSKALIVITPGIVHFLHQILTLSITPRTAKDIARIDSTIRMLNPMCIGQVTALGQNKTYLCSIQVHKLSSIMNGYLGLLFISCIPGQKKGGCCE